MKAPSGSLKVDNCSKKKVAAHLQSRTYVFPCFFKCVRADSLAEITLSVWKIHGCVRGNGRLQVIESYGDKPWHITLAPYSALENG